MAFWQAGDQAICVTRTPWLGYMHGHAVEAPGPGFMEVYEVTRVDMGIAPAPQEEFLAFAEFPMATYYHRHFRKLTGVEPDGDEEVVRALRGERRPEPAVLGVDLGREL